MASGLRDTCWNHTFSRTHHYPEGSFLACGVWETQWWMPVEISHCCWIGLQYLADKDTRHPVKFEFWINMFFFFFCHICDILILTLYSLFITHSNCAQHSLFYLATLCPVGFFCLPAPDSRHSGWQLPAQQLWPAVPLQILLFIGPQPHLLWQNLRCTLSWGVCGVVLLSFFPCWIPFLGLRYSGYSLPLLIILYVKFFLW